MRKPLKKIPLVILVLILALGTAASLAWAGNSPNFAIRWQVLAAGGQPAASSSGLSLNGTLGQSLSGSSSSGYVVLETGYWSKAPHPYVYYYPIIGR